MSSNHAPSDEGLSPGRKLPPWLWLWLPFAIVPAQLGAKLVGHEFYRATMRGERGLVEVFTVVFLIGALALALATYSMRQDVRSKLFGPAMLLLSMGTFYFAGEEASWGQHWLGFEPPEAVAARNGQGEFNLHNDRVLGRLLDDAPRAGLTLAVFVGGIVVPFLRRKKPARRDFQSPSVWGWIWPSRLCVPAAVFAVGVTLPDKIFDALGRETPDGLDFSPGETKELCLALFLLIYVATLRMDLKQAGPRAIPAT